MGSEPPIPPYVDRVQSDWIDHDGHMGEAYFVETFAEATNAFYDEIGLDAITRARSQSSVYALEAHVCYLIAVGDGVPLKVTTRVLDYDENRAHIFHEMRHGETGTLLATEELLLVHVDTAQTRAAAFPPEVVELLRGLQEAQADQPRPAQAGRVIGIARAAG